jgi:hypothetical protein
VKSEPIIEIAFGQGGNDAFHLGAGWSGDEPGFRWTIGGRSEVWLNHPGSASDMILELDVSPFVVASSLPAQRFRVRLRDKLIADTALTGPCKLGFQVPASVLADAAPLRFVFDHPDARRPADFGNEGDGRQLAVCFRRLLLSPILGHAEGTNAEPIPGLSAADIGALTGSPAVQFMQRFESLGDNCEFGLVQRRCGAEPLGLLRFANLELRQLLHGLELGFEGLGDRAGLEFWLSEGARREYVIRDRRYALVFHTFLYQGEVSEDELLEKQSRRLGFLVRKLLQDLENGEKIFVCKRNIPLTAPEILALHAALNRFGRNTLLWIVSADDNHSAGAVDQILPGLLRGYVARFAPYENAHDLSLEPWLSVCVNAARLVADNVLAT